jgi:hypothetical protein
LGTRKSRRLDAQQQFVLHLFEKLLSDLAQRHPEVERDLARDLETLRSRISEEGLSFATKALPKLGKAFDAALDSGIFEAPLGFKRSKGCPAIPAFLQGMLKMCFSSDGSLGRPHPSVVQDIRQVCYLVYKMQLPYSEQEEARVIESFLETEKELASLEIPDCPVIKQAQSLLETVFEGFDPRDILPRHGPGAVATGERLEEKWEFSRLYSQIHQKYPYYEYFVVGGAPELADRIQWYRSLDRLDTGFAKVVLVPKDSRGPRLISMEPLEFQWVQQGLNRALVRRLESHWLTSCRVNFSSQDINRELALSSSKNHFYATMDLKDASDRVSVQLVEKIFPKNLLPYLMAVRSSGTDLPDGRRVTLNKYAPMGSAVCFSVEAACFWALSVCAVSNALQCSHREAASFVYVYGDDLIVPSLAYEGVVEVLEMAGLRVNHSKCFYRGDFRESCGMDAYDGVDVTPTRVSRLWSSQPSDGQALSAYASYANQFAKKGYHALADFVWGRLAAVHGVLPHGTALSGYPNRNQESVSEAISENIRHGVRTRFSKRYQRWEVSAKVLIPIKTASELSNWPRVLRNLTMGSGEDPSEVTLPRRVKVKRRWVPIGYSSVRNSQ